ncbi:MAG: YggS family pyridoxal phosphate-dependent enzyme [Candidatus Marinimicrobia bacterium]|jgi:hypothetical protein|nr:YggS family pyridoxal phosphate-dependent enzyme [Candidatus Neomarinimicrobiota bacterium]|tara:strand:- start:9991 stop:10674 length:684 start_codon:yes stop_codon:yes gene_type:complete
MNLKKTIKTIKSRIDSAQERGGFDHPVQLTAVTKTHPFTLIENCYKAGITSIGENRVQEAAGKFGSFELMPNITRRFIGHLQTNKVNKCLELFQTIDSVDSIKLARRINERAKVLDRNVPVLLEINTSGEIQKHGFAPQNTKDMIASIKLDNLDVIGLMTMGPKTNEEKRIRNAFKKLRALKDLLNKTSGLKDLTELSMGMSGDYEIAVEEGSTMVRIGTALFGKRS